MASIVVVDATQHIIVAKIVKKRIGKNIVQSATQRTESLPKQKCKKEVTPRHQMGLGTILPK
jgi:hypothetical protein